LGDTRIVPSKFIQGRKQDYVYNTIYKFIGLGRFSTSIITTSNPNFHNLNNKFISWCQAPEPTRTGNGKNVCRKY